MNPSLTNLKQYRSQIGSFERRKTPPQPKKSPRVQKMKFETPLRNSHENPFTSDPSGNSSQSSSPSRPAFRGGNVMKLLTASLILASIASTESMAQGVTPLNNGRAEAMLPLLRMESRGGTHFCSGLRLNKRQLLTAKHCVATTPDAKIHMPSSKGGTQSASKVVKHPREDVAVVSFPEDFPGPDVCPPEVMKKPAYKRWLISEKEQTHGCGIETNTLIAGRGLKSSHPNALKTLDGKLTTGAFKLDKEVFSNRRLIMKGKSGDAPAEVLQGDSGAPVLACNDRAGTFELVGVVSGTMEKDEGSIHSNLANHRDYFEPGTPNLRPWLRQNTQPCTGKPVSEFELYPDKRHLERNFPKAEDCVDVKINSPSSTILSVDIQNQCPKKTITDISFDPGSKKDTITVQVHKNQSAHLSLPIDGSDINLEVSTRYSQKHTKNNPVK